MQVKSWIRDGFGQLSLAWLLGMGATASGERIADIFGVPLWLGFGVGLALSVAAFHALRSRWQAQLDEAILTRIEARSEISRLRMLLAENGVRH